MTPKPDVVLQTFIRGTRAALWQALTDAVQMTADQVPARDIRRVRDTLGMHMPDGSPMLRNHTLRAEPMHLIESTCAPQRDDTPPSRSVIRIDTEGDHCRLTIAHDDLPPPRDGNGVAEGGARWAARLKTWLETGTGHRLAAAMDEAAS